MFNNILKIALAATLAVLMNASIVQAHPASCQNNCMMNNGGACYMQSCEQKTCVKQGCDNERCTGSKYCENHKVKRVEPQNKKWGHHGHHGR